MLQVYMKHHMYTANNQTSTNQCYGSYNKKKIEGEIIGKAKVCMM